MSRTELAEAVNGYLWETRGRRYDLDGHAVARYERGAVRWPSAHYREAFRAVLGVDTDADLGFRPTRRGSTAAAPDEVLLTRVNCDAAVDLDLGVGPAEFLARTRVETPVPTCIGWIDVEHVRSATRAVAMSENLFGGGLSCEAAAAQLGWAGNLLEARADDDVRRAILEAVGNLSGVVAFSAFDIADYDAADRYFRFALWCASRSGSWSLRASTLADMARKAAYVGDLDGAISLIEFAQVRADRVSATARAMMGSVRARLLALVDRHEEARDDVRRADACFAARVPGDDPPWLCYYDEAEHQGSTGKAMIPVAKKTNTPDLAAPRLAAAVQLQDAHYPRSRAFSRIRLAALTMAVGDPREAATIGRQALVDAAPLRSQRLVNELHGFARLAEQRTDIDDVAELRRDIAALTPPLT
ncbi:XRE family transcriptional regulator [Amycolatopsis cihanbeyliensis]|uniref:Transcriptional regulator n=1 Tax=Amycolatopsis cihanbeyliensis TaxID=1128664 RepID=A0A542DHI8_AMYCI|nr:XRE family transcriptional regulator [Amycolatopsis cihanbeyliensis]TQJ02510.1 hypothetical protein FB471_2241 [Amycolatopsis cihanbeyliensis]